MTAENKCETVNPDLQCIPDSFKNYYNNMRIINVKQKEIEEKFSEIAEALIEVNYHISKGENKEYSKNSLLRDKKKLENDFQDTLEKHGYYFFIENIMNIAINCTENNFMHAIEGEIEDREEYLKIYMDKKFNL